SDALVASGQRPLELRAPVADDPMEIDLSSRQMHVPGLQDLNALVGDVAAQAGNRSVQSLPDLLFGEGLGDNPRTELTGFEADLEEGERSAHASALHVSAHDVRRDRVPRRG